MIGLISAVLPIASSAMPANSSGGNETPAAFTTSSSGPLEVAEVRGLYHRHERDSAR